MAVITRAGIQSVRVLGKCLSMRLTIYDESPEIPDVFRSIKEDCLEFSLSLSPRRDKNGEDFVDNGLGKIVFWGRFYSINLRERMHFLIHMEKIKPIIYNAIEMMDLPVALKFVSARDREIAALIDQAAKVLPLPEEEVIYRESGFVDR